MNEKTFQIVSIIIPFLIVAAGFLLIKISSRFNKIGHLMLIFFLSATLLWALAFFSIYTKEDSRITASRWIYQNIPKGSNILIEYHDATLPVTLQTNKSDIYNVETIDSFNSNNPDYYAERLTSADYIVLSSRRVYKTIKQLSKTYPLANKYNVPNKYYQMLFANQLGYKKISEFNSYPSLLGFIINDDGSEETFQVFDHPNIQIFQNTQNLNQDDYVKLLQTL